MSNQTPAEEMAERAAESIPGLAVAAKLEAVQNYRQANAAHRRRLNDSHKWQAEALGMTSTDIPEEEDEVGNLIVTGDVYGSDASEIIKSLQGITEKNESSIPQNTNEKKNNMLGMVALLAASVLGAGGVGAAIPALINIFTNEQTVIESPAIQPNGETTLGIEVVEGGAL